MAFRPDALNPNHKHAPICNTVTYLSRLIVFRKSLFTNFSLLKHLSTSQLVIGMTMSRGRRIWTLENPISSARLMASDPLSALIFCDFIMILEYWCVKCNKKTFLMNHYCTGCQNRHKKASQLNNVCSLINLDLVFWSCLLTTHICNE